MILRPAPGHGARYALAACILVALAGATAPSADASASTRAGQVAGPASPASQETTMTRKSAGDDKAASAARGVKGLPYAAPERVFANLDEYLAHRAYVATVGAPTLRELSPGRFIEEAADGQKRYYTREQLLRMFGFDE